MEEGAGLTGSAGRGGAEEGRGGVAGCRCSALCLPSPPGWQVPGVGAGFQHGQGVSSPRSCTGQLPHPCAETPPRVQGSQRGWHSGEALGVPKEGAHNRGWGESPGRPDALCARWGKGPSGLSVSHVGRDPDTEGCVVVQQRGLKEAGQCTKERMDASTLARWAWGNGGPRRILSGLLELVPVLAAGNGQWSPAGR